MSLIADGVLIATCLTTAIYCVILSRRLKRLSATDDGIGQQILRLNEVLGETKAAVADIQGTTRTASEELAGDIDAARRLGEQLQRQIARAMKNGVGRRESDPVTDRAVVDRPVAGGTAGATPAAAAANHDARDAIAEAAPVVDFEAAAEIGRPEDDIPGAGAADEDHDEAFDDGAAQAWDEEPGASDDIAEASDHWPFDESGEAMVSDEDTAELTGADHEEPEPETPPGESRENSAGLLRVERMAV